MNRPHFPSASVVIALLVLVCITPLLARGKPSFTVTSEPAWVLKQGKIEPRSASGQGSTRILDDEQIRLSSRTVEHFYHRSERVDTSSGLDSVSQLRFYFEPSYEQLAIHFIRIIRDNQTINALRPADIKVVQNEEELDDQLYNGTLVALPFLNDIRVGDIVDYAYTVSGNNPVFGGRFVDRFALASGDPIQLSRVRLLVPTGREIHIREHGGKFEPRVTSLGTETEYLWEATDLPAIEFEDSTPGWFTQTPFFTVSEFPDWPSVVQWAAPLYRGDEPLPSPLKTK